MMLTAEYGRLLQDIRPSVPRNRAENERLLGEIEKLMKKGEDRLTPAEDAMLAVLFSLVREYEHRLVARKACAPVEMLQFLMEQNHFAPADLPLPANRVSEILSGKRGISKDHAKQLGAFFRVSPALFI
jgi:antitoxin component HigA of HigAB toxin-antitoxin module